MNQTYQSHMSKHAFQSLARLVALCAIIFVPAVGNVKGADAPRVRRVLILHSFGRDFAPFNAVSSGFRTELARQSAEPIEFLEASLETARFVEGGSETPFVEYLRALFAERPPHLLVPFGAPAMNFLLRHRDKLFPGVPLLVGTVDRRRLSGVNLGANATAVGVSLDLPGIIENILQILPGTTNIEVVIGNSPLERFWLAELRQDFEPFTNRVRFNWLNELSFEEMRRRLATLPHDTVVLYAVLLVDAAGVPHEQDRALGVIHSESNAPIFGAFDNQLGRGIVGGPLYRAQEVSRESARLAVRILTGESPGSIQPVLLGPGTPVYDWRELKRWKINESRLPPGSVVRFREPTVWEQYRWYVIGGVVVIAVQAALIVGLLLHRARRRRAEADLRESQQFMELATSAGELGLWVRDLARSNLWVNNPLRSLLGLGQNDAIQLDDVLSRIHPDDRPRVIPQIERAQAAGLPFEVEFRALLPDGTARWLVARGRAIHDPEGLGHRRMGAVIDITERKRAEERFRLAVEASPSAIVMVDQQSQIVLVNEQTEKLFGYSREELIGQSVEIFVPERFRSVHSRHQAGFFVEPRTRVMGSGQDLFARRKDGTEFLADIGLFPIQTQEGVLVLTAIVDLTERRRADSELQHMREELAHVARISTMGELAASLAHELNQPLTAILSNAQAAQHFMAANPADMEEVREILKDIVQDNNRAGDVIRRMRALVKKEELAFGPLDLESVIRDVVLLVHSDAVLRNVRISLEFSPGLPPVQGDKVQLQQVVLNLLLNAFEAMKDCPPNEREVLVQTELDGAGMVEVAVRDHGTGLSSDKLDKIFQPFYTTKREGLGMGLSISRSIIEAHGGKLWAENNNGKGATLYFTVPVEGIGKR